MSFEVVPVDKAADMNVIIGQAHFNGSRVNGTTTRVVVPD